MSSDTALQIAVVGAGASGLLVAGFAAKRGLHVTVFEKNDRPARKLMITGKGRCNVTNNCGFDELIQNIPHNGKFMYSAFQQFGPSEMMNLIEGLGVPLKTERGNRVFPVSDKAVDIVDALVRFAKKNGAHFVHDRVTGLIIENGCCSGVVCENGKQYNAQAVVVCTGGVSYPGTGSTGDGYVLAKQAGHTVFPPKPSLVPLTSSDSICLDSQGLSLKNCSIRIVDKTNNNCVYDDFGEMIFTHFGVSGPVILSASSHVRDFESGKYRLLIDLKPAMTREMLDARIIRDMVQYKNMDLQNALIHLLPKKIISSVLLLADVDGATKCHSLEKSERTRLVDVIKNIPISITGTRPISEAIVTSGGIAVKEISPKTMESKLCKNLFFAGEVIDVDAYTGGFNLQIAFSTGYAAATHLPNT